MPATRQRGVLKVANKRLDNVALPTSSPRFDGNSQIRLPQPFHVKRGPQGASALPALAQGSRPQPPAPKAFDFSALPPEVPRTPRAPVAPLLARRPLQPINAEDGNAPLPTAAPPAASTSIAPPGPPFGTAVGLSQGLVPLAPPAPPGGDAAASALRAKQSALKPETSRMIRQVRTPRWKSNSVGHGAPTESLNGPVVGKGLPVPPPSH